MKSKLKKPEVVKMLKCSDGSARASLPEWQQFEVFRILARWKDSSAEPMDSVIFNNLVTHVLGAADELTHILSQREKGRPVGSTDKKPRKTRQPATTADLDGPKGAEQ